MRKQVLWERHHGPLREPLSTPLLNLLNLCEKVLGKAHNSMIKPTQDNCRTNVEHVASCENPRQTR